MRRASRTKLPHRPTRLVCIFSALRLKSANQVGGISRLRYKVPGRCMMSKDRQVLTVKTAKM